MFRAVTLTMPAAPTSTMSIRAAPGAIAHTRRVSLVPYVTLRLVSPTRRSGNHAGMTRDLTPDLLALLWRTGGHPALAVLAMVGDGRFALVGMMASPEVAALVVEAHNTQLSVHPGASSANAAIRAHLAAVERGDSPAA